MYPFVTLEEGSEKRFLLIYMSSAFNLWLVCFLKSISIYNEPFAYISISLPSMNESFGPKYILDISFIVWPLQQTFGERAVRLTMFQFCRL